MKLFLFEEAIIYLQSLNVVMTHATVMFWHVFENAPLFSSYND